MMFLPVSLLVAGCVFVPLLVIALVRFKSAAIAVAVSATFSVGAGIGLLLGLILVDALSLPVDDPKVSGLLVVVFACAGAVSGASSALWLLRRYAGDQNWEQR
jgi:hypothetical protein